MLIKDVRRSSLNHSLSHLVQDPGERLHLRLQRRLPAAGRLQQAADPAVTQKCLNVRRSWGGLRGAGGALLERSGLD